MAVIAGIDGCRAGWLCLSKNRRNGMVQATILPRINDLLKLRPRPDLAMIDMPIGLPDAGPRDCDRLARQRLRRPRASSVFSAPIRSVLQASTFQDACALSARVQGRKLSKQLWWILPKIRELDSFLRCEATRAEWIREFHPEVSFWAWNGQRAMTHSKRSAPGRLEREALVKAYAADGYAAARECLPPRTYQIDDLLDAFAGLWTGERVIDGLESVLPPEPIFDSCGLRMEIVV